MERFELPEGWELKRIGDVAPIDNNPILPTEYPDTLFTYIALENIESNTGNLIKVIPTRGSDIKSNKFVFDQAHVLFGKLRPYLNKVVIPNFSGICSTDILPLRPKQEILTREYLCLFLRSSIFIEYTKSKMEGTKMPRLRTPDLESYEIPIPPLDEQRRIVARIEELTKRVEEAKKIAKDALAELDTFTPALLAKAFRGEL